MSFLLSLWLCFLSTPAQAAAFRATAPEYLTVAASIEHLGSARVAAARSRVPVEVLLSIAHHESRYMVRTVTVESGDRVSCGVMTPSPQARCHRDELTVLGGYLAGAAHLRVWLDVCDQDLRCALDGYAGGYALIARCRRPDPACAVVDVFLTRAARIRVALATR